jgi:hypothetical protein
MFYIKIFLLRIKKMAKVKTLTKEDIQKINQIALEELSNMQIRRGRKSQHEDFLLEIKEVISEALKKEIPFTQLSDLIKRLYKVEITVHILKSFAKKYLDYKPKKRPTIDQQIEEMKKNKIIKSEKKSESKNDRKKSEW